MQNGPMDMNLDLKLDEKNLYREESFTDMKKGSIRKLTPANTDGTDDDSRIPMFIGSTTLMSPKGPLPIQCQIQAKTLQEAIGKFPAALEEAVKNMVEAAQKAQREDASRIIVPGQ
jgi:hypothetical protein